MLDFPQRIHNRTEVFKLQQQLLFLARSFQTIKTADGKKSGGTADVKQTCVTGEEPLATFVL